MVDPKMKPLCDQLHGEMAPVNILVGEGDRFPGFQCQSAMCGRVFTELNGYRDWVQGRGGSKARSDDPRCREHQYWMYVREIFDDFTFMYACPDANCKNVERVEMRDGNDGIWRRKGARAS